MHLFYLPELVPSTKSCLLSEEESKHACRVLRMKVGDKVELLDGKGGIYSAEINDDNPKRCELIIRNVVVESLPSYEIHIAIAPTKNMDRIEWFVEKATELGVTKISFLKCDRSERKVLNLERIEKIVVAAMKQSKRTFLPVLEPLVTFSSFVDTHKNGVMAHCEEDVKESAIIVASAMYHLAMRDQMLPRLDKASMPAPPASTMRRIWRGESSGGSPSRAGSRVIGNSL
jgi:16S rRNA (uracil1498-N3)-methyltransferase